jgi:hypothetical protein
MLLPTKIGSLEGMETFRGKNNPKDLCGPRAKLTQALCVNESLNHSPSITGGPWVEDQRFYSSEIEIKELKRTGLNSPKKMAGEN